jgi:formamidopyrimidine-DNA glycosylase
VPELPEVEHAARVLRKWLDGRRVTRVDVPRTRVVRGTTPRAIRAVTGSALARIDRVGKYLLLSFENDAGLLIHLGMSGHFSRVERGARRPRHVRLALRLDDGGAICFSDPRMFGRVAAHRAADLASLPEIARHGPDALRDLDARTLAPRLARTSRAVKVALLDPSTLAGVGNIQATEALWRARIDPRRPADSLDRREVARLARAIKSSLEHTLSTLTGDELEYVSAGGDNPFVVYDRKGTPCPRCRRPLVAITQAARTTTWCPHCQR